MYFFMLVGEAVPRSNKPCSFSQWNSRTCGTEILIY